jgi:2-polyprenyl-3-methyl-5-hydroxy-6-metoxy-1,4-benzoquinol methylase
MLLRLAYKNKLASIRILDLGCGSGDVASEIAIRVASQMPCHVTGWDMSPLAVATASQQIECVSKKTKDRGSLDFEVMNVFEGAGSHPASSKPFDFVYCSLFLHHFDDRQAVQILSLMRDLASHAVIVDDLYRSRFGLLLAIAGCHLLSRSPVVRFDGPQSVRASFARNEIERLAKQAELPNVSIANHWPARFLMVAEHLP